MNVSISAHVFIFFFVLVDFRIFHTALDFVTDGLRCPVGIPSIAPNRVLAESRLFELLPR
jgi:hypothetical protein